MFFDMHSSCIIDKAFMDKYCNKDNKKGDKKTDEEKEAGIIVAKQNLNELEHPRLHKEDKEDKEDKSDALKRAVLENVEERDENTRLLRKKKARITSAKGVIEKRVEVNAIEIDNIFVGNESK